MSQNKPIVYIDLDGVVVDLLRQMEKELLNSSKQYVDPTDLIDESETIFMDAQPIEGALEAIAQLETKYDVFILSTAPWHNVHSWMQKRLWVEKYLPTMYKKLILTHRKDLLMGDYLIDDRTKNGAGAFKGKHLHIFTEAYPTWQSVLDELVFE